MGFNKVYRSLREVFPQVDARALRAVAIEHSKDADAAVEAVLVEVIPFFTERSMPNISSTWRTAVGESSQGAIAITQSEADCSSVNAEAGSIDGQNDCIANAGYQDFFVDDFSEPLCHTLNRSMPNSSTRRTAVEESSQGAIAITQSEADCSSVNAEAGSIDGQNVCSENAGYQDFFVDGFSEPLCHTLNEGDDVPAESTMRGSVLENNILPNTDICYCDESAQLTDKERVTDLQIDVSVLNEGDDVGAGLIMCGCVLENNTQLNTDIRSHNEPVNVTDKDRVNAPQVEVSVEIKTDNTASDGKYPANSSQLESDPCRTLGNPKENDAGIDSILKERADHSLLYVELDTATNKDSDWGKNSGDGKTCVVGPSSFIAHDIAVRLPENNLSLQKLDGSLPDKTTSKIESSSIVVGNEDESTLNGSLSESSKICMIDALSKIIVDARNNKKMLFSAMDPVSSLMREVELKEKISEQAKMEASIGGSDILIKSEELKKMLKQAEETNSMHAGEIYGEKAILATELRELQSRALSLSVERDKYLAVLDEMRQTLEVRLAEAQNVIESAEQEKIEKENAAMKSFTEQELIMEKVLQESKSLNQQADDNAKLREFLVDRGRVVDTLQGEISVICQDVRLLKEKFDAHIPFSKSLSYSQTTCILASPPDQVESLPDQGVAPMDAQNKKDEVSVQMNTHLKMKLLRMIARHSQTKTG